MQFLDVRVIHIVSSALETTLYLPIIIFVLRRREEQETAALLLTAYAG